MTSSTTDSTEVSSKSRDPSLQRKHSNKEGSRYLSVSKGNLAVKGRDFRYHIFEIVIVIFRNFCHLHGVDCDHDFCRQNRWIFVLGRLGIRDFAV
jgi:hypothetical protein